MASDNLLSTLEQTLRQTKSVRARLLSRLTELESETGTLKSELRELDNLTAQTEAAIYRLLSGSFGNAGEGPQNGDILTPSSPGFQRPGKSEERTSVPPLRTEVEVTSDRFLDRTIPQAATVLLREAGGPLHVNEIYNLLLEGGFNFTGHNPTISIAVSLNRNGRFRKVAPGTFDLVMRDAAQAS
jgi:hypothetical protein